MENTLSQREILDIATNIGYHILQYGGEIHRAEDTVSRICLAYGMDEAHVFAISSSIVITVEKDGVARTQTKRVKAPTTNLDRIAKFNDLSRRICRNCPSYKEVMDEINEIENRHCYNKAVSVLSYAIIGGSFAVFFGGWMMEFLVGMVVGALVRLSMLFLERFDAPPFFINAAGAAVTVVLVRIFELLRVGVDVEFATIGVLMNLVPGVLLTNCIRDFVATDYTAGTAKIVEAFITAAAIALGVAVSIFWR